MPRQLRRMFVAPRAVVQAIVACQLLLLAGGNSPVGVARADEPAVVETQRREFAISVDSGKRGTCTMQIRRTSDGTLRLRSEAELHIHVLVYNYDYTSSGTEIWKDGRLLAMENVADYNGTQYRVKASPAGKGLQVTTDGSTVQLPSETWVTSYWQTPEKLALGELADRTAGDAASINPAEARGPRYLAILDSDKGQQLHGKLVREADETLTLAGQARPCTHYSLKGDVHVKLWYDASGRLVQEDSIERHHRVRFALNEVAAE